MAEKRTAKRSGNNGNHGKPGRSGRRPSILTVLKRRLIENKAEEADASFAFLVAVRDNKFEPTAQRTAAAMWIFEQVYGKAKTRAELTGADGGPIATRDVTDLSDDELKAIASGATVGASGGALALGSAGGAAESH